MKKHLLAIILLASAVSLQAQTDRVTKLQNARNLAITTTDGNSILHMVSTDKSLMFHKQGSELNLNGQSMQIGDIKTMRLLVPTKFIINEDSATFTPRAIDNGLLAFRNNLNVGKWNTLVVPFSLTGEQVIDAFGEGTQLAIYSGITEGDVAQIDLTLVDLNTSETVLKANSYYIIRPTRDPDIAPGNTTSVNYGTAKVSGPAYIIYNVSMEKGKDYVANQSLRSAENNVTMRISGTYKMLTDRQKLYYGTREYFCLNDEGLFYLPTDSVEMKAFHNWVVTSKNSNNLPVRFYVNGIGEDLTATGIEDIVTAARLQDDSYYDLSGRKVANGSWMNRPMRKGLYINNGKKVIVR